MTEYISRHGQWVLDGRHKYQSTTGKRDHGTGEKVCKMVDSPNQGYDDDARTLTATDRFKTFVMFVPPGTDARPVPLKVIEWGWQGKGEWDEDVGWGMTGGKATVPKESTVTGGL